MRVLVTGATGFIGRRLIPELLNRGLETVVLLREKYAADVALPSPLNKLRPKVEVVYGDLRNYRLTRRAVERARPSGVIHLAASGVTDPFLSPNTALRHNTNGTLNLLQACFKSRSSGLTDHCIIGRTPGELTAMNPYAVSKAAGWMFGQMYARMEEWPIVGAMIFQVYGPDQAGHTLVPSAIAAACSGLDFPMTTGDQLRDWIYVDDVVDGILAVLTSDLSPGDTVDIGTGLGSSVAEVVKEIYRQAGMGGKPLLGALPERPGETFEQVADTRRTFDLIGWRAKTTLRDGIQQMIGGAKK